MILYPFCIESDVIEKLLQRTISASSKPSTSQIKRYMEEIANQILSICSSSGYDINNLHENSTTIALAISAGSSITVVAASGTAFSKGNIIKIEGLTSGARAWEFCEITNVSGNSLTLDTVSNNYDAGVSIVLVNGALNTLRDINALGAAWMAEQNTFMSTSPNKSEHADKLMTLYFGSEKLHTGLWAIENKPGFLVGATQTTDAPAGRSTICSYGSEHEDDSDVKPRVEIDENF